MKVVEKFLCEVTVVDKEGAPMVPDAPLPGEKGVYVVIDSTAPDTWSPQWCTRKDGYTYCGTIDQNWADKKVSMPEPEQVVMRVKEPVNGIVLGFEELVKLLAVSKNPELIRTVVKE